MSHVERLLEYLRSIAPRGAANSELFEALDGPSRPTVFRLTREMLQTGQLCAQRHGRQWIFYPSENGHPAVEMPFDESAPTVEAAIPSIAASAPEMAGDLNSRPADYDWPLVRSSQAHQVRWLTPLLSRSEGRQWLLRRVGVPSLAEELERARVFYYCSPLQDLLRADLAEASGDRQAEDAVLMRYNQWLRLPAEFGLADIWRRSSSGKLRLPVEGGRVAWKEKLLAKRCPNKDLQQGASSAVRLMGLELAGLLLTPRRVVLVECCLEGDLSLSRYRRLHRLANVLEHRLGRTGHLATMVERVDQLPALEIAHIAWNDVIETVRAFSAD